MQNLLEEKGCTLQYLLASFPRCNKAMNLAQILESGASNISLTVTPADLKEFAVTIFEQCREEYAPKAQDETYHSRKEVKCLLCVSDATLWRWQKNGYLVPTRVGAKVRYKHSDIVRVLNEDGGQANG